MPRVGVIGVGNMGYHHARNYAEIPNAQLVAVADPNEERGRSVAERFSCRFFRSFEQMLEKEAIEAVSIVLPTNLHYQVARQVIAAGIPALVEKPLAATVAEAEALTAAARERGVLLAVGHIERFNPAVQELRRRLDAGELGAVRSVVAKRVGVLPPQVKDANVIVDLAVHDIDVIGYLLGSAPTEVYAAGGRALLSDRLDDAEIFLKYGDIGCFIQVNWITPLKIRTLSVTGSAGYAELNYVTQKLEIYQSNVERHFDDFGDFVIRFGTPRTVTVPITAREPLRLELEAFLQAVEGKSANIVSGEEGTEALVVAYRALEALKQTERA